MAVCELCSTNRAVLKRSKTGQKCCKSCFFQVFELEVYHTITRANLFRCGEKVAIAASGGKDSTVLAHVMTTLNERYKMGLELTLLSVDEGITGYRDDSLETVKTNQQEYGLPLKIVSYKELYGWTMDEIVGAVGLKNNCTFCGVFRRQALDRGAAILDIDQIVTGHNADDIAETVLMNILRGDLPRLGRCTMIKVEGEGSIPRSKPLKYAYEKEIVMYAYFKKLTYFSTECTYAPQAYRGFARAFIKEVEARRPLAILDIIKSGECFECSNNGAGGEQTKARNCDRCGYMSSSEFCKACLLLQGLDSGLPMLGIGRSKQAKRANDSRLAAKSDTQRGCGTGDCPCDNSKVYTADVEALAGKLGRV